MTISEDRSSEDQHAKLRELMARSRFVASRRELLAHGFSDVRIRSWKASGRLIRLFHGVYSYGRDIETRESAWRAALLAAGPGSALTGRSALEALGAVRLRPRIPDAIEVATEADRAGERRGLSPALRRTRVKVVRRGFEAGDVRRRDGLELTRPPWALIDFAVTASERELRFAFLELCRLRLFGERDVAYGFRRVTGRRGARKLKPLLGLWVPELKRVRSVLEGSFLLAWSERALPVPAVNEKAFGYEVDCLWRERGLALELDGDAFHTDPIARRRDLAKTRHLESKGLRVIRVTWREFMADPDETVDRVARELDL